jgi:hypothetical protein
MTIAEVSQLLFGKNKIKRNKESLKKVQTDKIVNVADS